MEEEILAQIEAADQHPQPSVREPIAKEIAFDPNAKRFLLRLENGVTVGFDADALWELQGAGDDLLADVGLSPSGGSIVWAGLDMHVSLGGLIMDLLGGPEWKRVIRQEAARQVARSGSQARTAASRENGKKGGRPRKQSA